MKSIIEKIKPLQIQLQTTNKVLTLLGSGFNKKELSEELGISRPTLDSRLDSVSKWKKLEKNWINKLYVDL
jgi:hypothetical protein